ncbi:MAG: FAD-binding oxidoreductase [Dermatophilaceae bacterium]
MALLSQAEHARAVGEVRAAFGALDPSRPVRLAKRTSNLFRARAATSAAGLDVSKLDAVVEVDPASRTAQVQGMATYERVVDETLEFGLMPLVVPQLKTITLGGAVTGLGIESSSFRNGLPHESVLSMDILTGTGEVVTATPTGEHADLYRAFPNSYGSLGYAMSLTVELEPVANFVRLRHLRFFDVAGLLDAVAHVMDSRQWHGVAVDFVDGVVFARDECYLVLGTWADSLAPSESPSDYTGQHVYYRSIQHRARDVLTVRDYLWRWDTDWFWCSRAFGAQNPWIRRMWPKRWLRSDIYWKLVGIEQRYHPMARLDAMRGRPQQERVIQDVELPLDATGDFLDWFLREVPVEPIWLCPVQLRGLPTASGPVPGLGATANPSRTAAGRPSELGDETPWSLYPMHVGVPYVNVGFWSTVPVAPGAVTGDVNREIERVVGSLGGHKSLYSDAYYDREDFLAQYGGTAYQRVKGRYDPVGRFPDLYDKAVRRQ